MKYLSPNHRETLTATNRISGQNEYLFRTNHALDVNVVSGGGGGTQYTEGDTTSPAIGTAFLGRYTASPSGISTDGGLYAHLMDNFHQLKVVPVGTISANMTQINGVTVATGNGTVNTGTQRVALASASSTLRVKNSIT